MNTYVIEIKPKSKAMDPLAGFVERELLEAGVPKAAAKVETRRLFKVQANLTKEQAEKIAGALLVDPVVEIGTLEENADNLKKKKPAKPAGIVLDVWPKPGVTDPVGETVEKGVRDLGFAGDVHSSTAQRYVFPKIKDRSLIKNLAKRVLANELIHDLHIR